MSETKGFDCHTNKSAENYELNHLTMLRILSYMWTQTLLISLA